MNDSDAQTTQEMSMTLIQHSDLSVNILKTPALYLGVMELGIGRASYGLT